VSRPVVALFDVDGTLLDSGGAGARSWARAFDERYGVPADIDSSSEAGETDPVVARATFRASVGRDPEDDELARLFASYLYALSEEVAGSPGYRVLPGVVERLLELSHEGVLLGLTSGAMEGAARVKLSRGDLNRFFMVGGYGSDSSDRAELTRIAIAKASLLHGHDVPPARVAVVGDTPRDVEAARGAGAISVAVASGRFSAEELRAAGADHVLASLEDPFPDV